MNLVARNYANKDAQYAKKHAKSTICKKYARNMNIMQKNMKTNAINMQNM